MKFIGVSILAPGLVAAVSVRADSHTFGDPCQRTGALGAAGSLPLENVNGGIRVERR